MGVTKYFLTGMILQVGGGFNTLFHLFSLPGEMIQFDGEAYSFSHGLMKNHQKRWTKTDFAALGRPIFVAMPGGWWGKLYLCNLDDDNEPPIYNLGVLQIFGGQNRWFSSISTLQPPEKYEGLTQPGCWFCIYVNAQAYYATCCKSQLFPKFILA